MALFRCSWGASPRPCVPSLLLRRDALAARPSGTAGAACPSYTEPRTAGPCEVAQCSRRGGARPVAVSKDRATIARLHQAEGRRPTKAVPAGERVGPKRPGRSSPEARFAELPRLGGGYR